MKLTLVLAVALPLAAALPIAVLAQMPTPHGPQTSVRRSETPDQARREIRRLYMAQDVAYDRQDSGARIALLTPDYVDVEQDGKRYDFAEMSSRIRLSDERGRQAKQGSGERDFIKTDLRRIVVTGNRATVLWSQHAESLASRGGAWGHVVQEAAGEDRLIRTPQGWRFQWSHTATEHRTASGGLTPEAALAVQKVFQAKRLLDQEIAGEQASDAQQQQMRVEQNQHDQQVWRKKQGY